jgi:hypothetical protein
MWTQLVELLHNTPSLAKKLNSLHSLAAHLATALTGHRNRATASDEDSAAAAARLSTRRQPMALVLRQSSAFLPAKLLKRGVVIDPRLAWSTHRDPRSD